MVIESGTVPALWKLARLEFDAVRGQRVLLYPEGVVLLNETGAAILDLVDGRRTIADINTALEERYSCGDVTNDITEYLSGLASQGLVRWRTPGPAGSTLP